MKRKQIGFYLLTWAGMFLRTNGALSARPVDAKVWATLDLAQGAADAAPAEYGAILIGNVYAEAAP